MLSGMDKREAVATAIFNTDTVQKITWNDALRYASEAIIAADAWDDSDTGVSNAIAVLKGSEVDQSKPKRATRGTRLPEGWKPAAPSVARIREQFPSVTSAELQYEHEKFTDFWNGKSGANATKLDWEGTWKNWMRRAFERRRGVPGAVAGNDQKIADLQSMKSGRG